MSTPVRSARRAFTTPEPDDDWGSLARRVLPDVAQEAAVQQLRSWNLHLFARNPPGEFLNSDVIFVEPPRQGDAGGA
jgi:hypothetical protein